MFVRRLVGLVALLFGFVGVLASGYGIYAAWQVESSARQASDRVFAAVDNGFVVATDKVASVRQRLAEHRVTASEITRDVREWVADGGRERLQQRLDIEHRSAVVAERLRTVDVQLESAAEMTETARKLIDLGRSAGASMNPETADQVLGKIARLREALGVAERAIDDVHKAASEPDDRWSATVRTLLVQVAAAILDADGYLAAVEEKLDAARAAARQTQADANDGIFHIALLATVILVWIAAGQAALCGYGWRCLRRGPPA
jgi:hypothetical protein